MCEQGKQRQSWGLCDGCGLAALCGLRQAIKLMSAMGLGMRGIGIEIDEESCEKAARRLEQGVQTKMEAMG